MLGFIDPFILPPGILRNMLPSKTKDILKNFEDNNLVNFDELCTDLAKFEKNHVRAILRLVEYIHNECKLAEQSNIEQLTREDINAVREYDNPTALLETLYRLKNNNVKLKIKIIKDVIATDLETFNRILNLLEEYDCSQEEDIAQVLEHHDRATLLKVLNMLSGSLCLTAENLRGVMFIAELGAFKSILDLLEKYFCLERKDINAALTRHHDYAGLLQALNILNKHIGLTVGNARCVIAAKLDIFNKMATIIKKNNCLKLEDFKNILEHGSLATLLNVLACLNNCGFLNEKNKEFLSEVFLTVNIDDLHGILVLLKENNCLNLEDLKSALKHDNPTKLLETLNLLKNHEFLNEQSVKGILTFDLEIFSGIHNALDLFEEYKCDYSPEDIVKILKHRNPSGLLNIIKTLKKHNFLNTETVPVAVGIDYNYIFFTALSPILCRVGEYNCPSADVITILKHKEPMVLLHILQSLEKQGFLNTKNVGYILVNRSLNDLNEALQIFSRYKKLELEDITALLKYDNPTNLSKLLRVLKYNDVLSEESVEYVIVQMDLLQLLYENGFLNSENKQAFSYVKDVLLKPHDDPTGRLKLLRSLKERNFLNEGNVWNAVAHAKPAIVEPTLGLLKQQYGRAELQEDIENVIKHGNRPDELLMGLQELDKYALLNTANVARIMVEPKPLVVALLLIVIKQDKRGDLDAALKEPDMQRLEQVLNKLYDKSLLTPETWTVVLAAYPHLENINAKLDRPQFMRALQELKSADLLTPTNFLAAMAYTSVWTGKDDSSNLPKQLLENGLGSQEKQEYLNVYVHKATKANPSIWDDPDCLIVPIEMARKSALSAALPAFELIELPFAINKEVYSVITAALAKKFSAIADMNTPFVNIAAALQALLQVLFVQGLWLEGRVGAETQQYLTDLSPKLEPLLRAALKNDAFSVALLNSKRIVFGGNKEAAEDIEEQLENAIETIECLVALQWPSKDRLSELTEKYIEVARYAEVVQGAENLKDFVRYVFWDIRARLTHSSDSSIQEFFKTSPFKEWAESPPDCYGGQTWQAFANIEAQSKDSKLQKNDPSSFQAEHESLKEKLASSERKKVLLEKQNKSLTEMLAPSEEDKVSRDEKVERLEGENAQLQKDNALFQAEYELLKERLASSEREKVLLEKQNKSLTEMLAPSEEDKVSRDEKVERLEGENAQLQKDNAAFQAKSQREWAGKKQSFEIETDKGLDLLKNWSNKVRNEQIKKNAEIIITDLTNARDTLIKELENHQNQHGTSEGKSKLIHNYTEQVKCIGSESVAAKELATQLGWNSVIRKVLVAFANAAIALTGIGLLPLSVQVIHSKLKQGHVSFFGQTPKSKQRIDKICEQFKQGVIRNFN